MAQREPRSGSTPPARIAADTRKARKHGPSRECARVVSNHRPLACEASALPLSYAPLCLQIRSFSPFAGLRGFCVPLDDRRLVHAVLSETGQLRTSARTLP